MTPADYVLITPVRDEEKFIGQTIASVLAQTILPREWIIVSDGSTDRTNSIVAAAADRHSWIRLIALPPRAGRDFAAVVKNTETGVRSLRCSDYNYLGLLDSDVTFAPGYFAELIRRFEAEPALGLAGGVVIDVGTPRDRVPHNRQDVPGAVQFFRRTCFESLGGLVAIPEGGWDALTCAVARMRGYRTRLMTDLIVDHHKPRNIAHGGHLSRRWQLGVRDFGLGYHPLFEFLKCCGKLHHYPVVLGATAWWLGYCASMLHRRKRHISDELLRYVRQEQLDRLRQIFSRRTGARA
jgi:biofilm PGA synthesis N-glycosyltransferase PgaC